MVLRVAARDGHVHTAFGQHPAPAGSERCAVVIRPEDVLLAKSGVPAEVCDREFYGHDQVLHVRVAGGAELRVRVGPGRAKSTGGSSALRCGCATRRSCSPTSERTARRQGVDAPPRKPTIPLVTSPGQTTRSAPVESPAERAAPESALAPRYHLVLLDDDHHTYAYVIEMLGRIFGHGKEKAFALARIVDTQGRVKAAWLLRVLAYGGEFASLSVVDVSGRCSPLSS